MGLVALVLASLCVAAPVSYSAPPDRGAPAIPWVHAGSVSGYLFYYGAPGPWRSDRERAIVATRGGGPGFSTKILWHVQGGYGRVIVIGSRLDGAGRFRQSYQGIAGSYFPSYLIVPSAGCWRVTVSSAGRRTSFAFRAVDL
ncbi:MAG TPA: hypothetical protein VGJ77_19520 [Gaiellaceae bacterium]